MVMTIVDGDCQSRLPSQWLPYWTDDGPLLVAIIALAAAAGNVANYI